MKHNHWNKTVNILLAIIFVTVQVTLMVSAAPVQFRQSSMRQRATPDNTGQDSDTATSSGTKPEYAENIATDSIIGSQTATPSYVTEYYFQSSKPDEEVIPAYYTRVYYQDLAFYLFKGRDGVKYWRIYGSTDEDSLDSWYACTEKGRVMDGAEPISEDEEYRTLAPYVYRSAEPEISELESRFPDAEYQVINDMGTNPDGTCYDIFEVSYGSEYGSSVLEYWLYGFIENTLDTDSEGAYKWYRCKDDGSLMGVIASAPQARWGVNAYVSGTELHIEYTGHDSDYAQAGDPKKSINLGISRGLYVWNGSSANPVNNWAIKVSATLNGNTNTGSDTNKDRIVIDKDGAQICTGYIYNIWQEGKLGSITYHVNMIIFNPHPELKYMYGTMTINSGGANSLVGMNYDIGTVAEAAHVHDSNITTTTATCTTNGSVKGTCSLCLRTEDKSIPALGHNKPANYDTVSVPGYKIKNCTRCHVRLDTAANQYYVAYHGNGGTGTMTSSIHTVGISKSLTANSFKRKGYQFIKWTTQADGSGSIYKNEAAVTDITLTDNATVPLYAQWSPIQYTVTFDAAGGRLQAGDETKSVAYQSAYGPLPIPVRPEYEFKGWEDSGGNQVTASSVYQVAAASKLTALWSIKYRDNGDGTNTRPGLDDAYYTADDKHFWNGEDKQSATEDDIQVYMGVDGIWATSDDWYQDSKGNQVFSGEDTVFGSKDDYIDNSDSTNSRSGYDLSFGTGDDELWWNGNDLLPGNIDDKLIHPGADSQYHTPDDYYELNGFQKIYAGTDSKFGTSDDFIDNSDDTNTRPGTDRLFDTKDDEIWWNGYDTIPGNSDDIRSHPGFDGIWGTWDDWYVDKHGNLVFAGLDQQFGTLDDFIDNKNNTNLRPGEDNRLTTGDDEHWWNGPDEKPGNEDDRLIYPGDDGQYDTPDDYYKSQDSELIHAGQDSMFGTPDDFIDNKDGTNSRPGVDGKFDSKDDETWWNGYDKKPGNDDDEQIHPGADGEWGTPDDWYLDKEGDQVFAGADQEFGTPDDFKDNKDNTNTRPGEDNQFGTKDDEKWWNGEDELPGNSDDRLIYPGLDGEHGTKDDFIDNEDGTNTRPGNDNQIGTEDDQIFDNGTDKIPGNEDDWLIQPPDNGGSEGGSNGEGSGGSLNGGSSTGNSGGGVKPGEVGKEDEIYNNGTGEDEAEDSNVISTNNSSTPNSKNRKKQHIVRDEEEDPALAEELEESQTANHDEETIILEKKVPAEKNAVLLTNKKAKDLVRTEPDLWNQITDWIHYNSLFVIEIGVGILLLAGIGLAVFFSLTKNKKQEK